MRIDTITVRNRIYLGVIADSVVANLGDYSAESRLHHTYQQYAALTVQNGNALIRLYYFNARSV